MELIVLLCLVYFFLKFKRKKPQSNCKKAKVDFLNVKPLMFDIFKSHLQYKDVQNNNQIYQSSYFTLKTFKKMYFFKYSLIVFPSIVFHIQLKFYQLPSFRTIQKHKRKRQVKVILNCLSVFSNNWVLHTSALLFIFVSP